MSQQINLLPRGPISPKLSARRALLTLSTFFLMLIAYGQWLHARANAAQQQTLDSGHALQAQRAKLLALQKKMGEHHAAGDIAAQIAALEPQTRVAKELLARLKSGELGSLDGYGKQFTALASLSTPGVWLTSISMSNAGRALRVEGRALHKQQVLTYARQLNAVMTPFGAQVSALEVTPVLQPAEPTTQHAAVFAFTLF